MVLLRNATDSDMTLVMAWHSNPLVYQGFYTLSKENRVLKWDEHYKWWTLTTKYWKKFIIVLVEDDFTRDVGIIRISPLESWCPEIGFTIGEVSLWNKGIGRKAVELACEWLKNNDYKYVCTTVMKSNQRAVRLLESLGFTERGEARPGEKWMQKNLMETEDCFVEGDMRVDMGAVTVMNEA